MRFFKIVLLSMIGLLASSAAVSQEPIVLTVVVPTAKLQVYPSDYFDDFRALHPNVDVAVINNDALYPPSVVSDVATHLNAIETYVSSGDLLWVNSSILSLESTLAGYWLDLLPLVTADPMINQGDLQPGVLDAFSWNNSLWALPIRIHPRILVFNKEAFDNAGFGYPNAAWTIDDLAQWARELTLRNADGQPITPGFLGDAPPIFYSQLQRAFFNHSDEGVMPNLNTPELAGLVEKWAPVLNEIFPQGSYSSEGVPVQLADICILTTSLQNEYIGALLPGGYSYASIDGFGISAGTEQPQLAYELMQYLLQKPPQIVENCGVSVYRTDLNMTSMYNALSPENQLLLTDSLANPISPSDLLFSEYVWAALSFFNERETVSSAEVLADVQRLAEQNITIAANTSTQLVISTPVPTLAPNVSALNFGIGMSSVHNLSDWQRVANEFIASGQHIEEIRINLMQNDVEAFLNTNDCYYLTSDGSELYGRDRFLNLSPLMSASPEFNSDTLLPGVAGSINLNNGAVIYPFAVEVGLITYDQDALLGAGLVPPSINWTTEEFVELITVLGNTYSEPNLFAPRYGNIDFIALIAAFGGLPVDYRSDPPTIDLISADNVNAIRQVLDLAKGGYITYNPLGNLDNTPTYQVGILNTHLLDEITSLSVDSLRLLLYPSGEAYKVIVMGDTTGGYIRADTLLIDPCFQWITFISSHTELFNDMVPAWESQLEEQVSDSTYDKAPLLQQLKSTLLSQQAIIFPLQRDFVDMFMENLWIGRAFDVYVLDDGDLTLELNNAQAIIAIYRDCLSRQPGIENWADTDSRQIYLDFVLSCAVEADPALVEELQIGQ